MLEAQVEFVVIGGVAAIAHGSTYMTDDLDVAVPLTVENCRRILKALLPYEPRFYQTIGRPLVTRSAEELAEFKNLYFETTLGVIDLLGSVPPLGNFETVAAKSTTKMLHGFRCMIVSLDDLIEVKAHVARPKDRAIELELRAIRDRLNQR